MSGEMRGNSILLEEREGIRREVRYITSLTLYISIFCHFFFEIPVYIPIYAYAYMKYMMMKDFKLFFFLSSSFSFLFYLSSFSEVIHVKV